MIPDKFNTQFRNYTPNLVGNFVAVNYYKYGDCSNLNPHLVDGKPMCVISLLEVFNSPMPDIGFPDENSETYEDATIRRQYLDKKGVTKLRDDLNKILLRWGK